MISIRRLAGSCLLGLATMACATATTWAQDTKAAPRPNGRGPGQGPQFVSPEVAPGRTVTFRLLAPEAKSVSLRGDLGDPRNGGLALTKGEQGVWELRTKPLAPGAYRYAFQVDGVQVADPRNPDVSQTNTTVMSLVHVPGAEFQDTNGVPHGAVAEVYYPSKALGKTRRMHVYTPSGYEAGSDRYPVFYLLHGAGDCDDSWSTVGRAGFILDNLIASGQAVPMIVVMPAGHTSREFNFGAMRGDGKSRDEFAEDFLGDLVPYVESHYRVHTDHAHRAIAGLSMGGAQTLNIAMANLGRFAYVGVFSSGIFGSEDGAWEKARLQTLDDAALKTDLKLLWFATGADDFLLKTTKDSLELLKKHGFAPVYEETAGGHTWANWRDYLHTFTPRLFQGDKISK